MQESNDQEVIRTIGQLKLLSNWNWWVGFGSGMAAILVLLATLAALGSYFNI